MCKADLLYKVKEIWVWGICITVMLLAGKKVGEFEKNVNKEFENGLKISLTLEVLLSRPAEVVTI